MIPSGGLPHHRHPPWLKTSAAAGLWPFHALSLTPPLALLLLAPVDSRASLYSDDDGVRKRRRMSCFVVVVVGCLKC